MRLMPIERAAALRGRLPMLGWPQWVGLGAALAISLALGYATYVRLTAKPPAVVQTVAVTRGAINAGVNGTGTVTAENRSSLSFRGSGRVASVDVKLGDYVEAGQVLARLDAADLQAQLESAQAGLAQAQAKLQTIVVGARPEDVAAAQAQVAQEQAHLADLLQPRAEDVDAARAALAQAQAKLDGMAAGRPEDVAAAQAALDSARAKLQQTLNGPLAGDLTAARVAVGSGPAPADSAPAQVAPGIVRPIRTGSE